MGFGLLSCELKVLGEGGYVPPAPGLLFAAQALEAMASRLEAIASVITVVGWRPWLVDCSVETHRASASMAARMASSITYLLLLAVRGRGTTLT